MTMGVLCRKGKAKRSIYNCDKCQKPIEEGKFSESLAVFKMPMDTPQGEYIAPIWIVHDRCAAPLIGSHDSPRGKWFYTQAEKLGSERVSYSAVDMEHFYANYQPTVTLKSDLDKMLNDLYLQQSEAYITIPPEQARNIYEQLNNPIEQ